MKNFRLVYSSLIFVITLLLLSVNSVLSQPAAPTNIYKPTFHCSGFSETYSIDPVLSATSYTWTVTGNNWILSPTSTTFASITAGIGSATISVAAINGGGNSPWTTTTMNVTTIPVSPASINKPATHCTNSSQTYTVTPVSNADSYKWNIIGTGWSVSSTMTLSSEPYIAVTAGIGTATLVVSAENVCGISSPTSCTMTSSTTPGMPGTITTATNHCIGTVRTYSISPVSGAVSYSWIVNGVGWSGSSTMTSIDITAGTGSATISVIAQNSCGNSIARTVTVSSIQTPATPSFSSVPYLHCANTTKLYQVAPVQYATTYSWQITGDGWIGSSTTNAISIMAGPGSATISCRANNSCGSSGWSSVLKAPAHMPGSPSFIYTPIQHCTGAVETYSIVPVEGATSYTWKLFGAGWTGSSNTNYIDIKAGPGTCVISVTANNACGRSEPIEVEINPSKTPSAVALIDTPIVHCVGTKRYYTAIPVADATSYTWTVKSNGTGPGSQWTTLGSDNNEIEITAGTGSADITVYANNSCGGSIAKKITVWSNSLPTQTGNIQKPQIHCTGTSKVYQVAAVQGALSYTWEITGNGWAGSSTTNSINIVAGLDSAIISVKANNDCGSSAATTTIAHAIKMPLAPAAIIKPQYHCQGTFQTYKATPVSGAIIYEWSINGTGWIGASTTDTINIRAGSGTAIISCSTINACGTSAAATTTVTSSPIPSSIFVVDKDSVLRDETATISYTGNASDTAVFNWDFDGGVATPGTGKGPHDVYWTTQGQKTIKLIVTEGGCPSQETLLSIYVRQGSGVGDEKSDKYQISIAPNPNTGNFTLKIDNPPTGMFKVQVLDLLGNIQYNKKLSADGSFSHDIALGRISSGTYFVKIIFGKEEIVKQIVIVK